MNDDRILDGVERLLQDATPQTEPRDADHSRWEALSLGTASRDEIGALEAEAAASALAAEHLEAYRPIDRQTRQRFLERVKGALETPRSVGGTPSSDDASNGDKPEDSEESTTPPRSQRQRLPKEQPPADRSDAGRIVPWPRRKNSVDRRRWLAPLVAALAATLLWVLWPLPQVTLPDYVLTAEAGRQPMRNVVPKAEDVLELEQGDPFEITLRPALAIEHPVTAHVYAERPNGLEAVTLEGEISDSGSIRLNGRFDHQLTGGANHVDLWIVVAAATASPELEDIERRRDGQPSDASWQLLRCRLQVMSRGET